jgi:uncharacterized membrane protein YdbT with pleckstrin-like domain
VVRLVPSGDTDPVPASVGRFLLPHERHVISVREHPIVLVGRTLAVLAGLAIAGVLTNYIHHNNTAILIIWLLWLVLVIWLVVKVVEWWVHYFVLTSKRLILAQGVLLKRVNALPVDKITDIEFRQSQAGRLLGWGVFEVFSAGQDPRMKLFKWLPYPGQLYLEVCAFIFKEDKDDRED